MLSNKMTVSLMSLITIFALVFAVGGADAAEKPFEITIMGPTTATYDTLTSVVTVDLIVESALAIPILDSTGDTPNVTAVVIDRRGFVDDATITVTDRAVADYPMRTAKKRQLRISVTQEADTVDTTKGLLEKVIITIPAGLKTTDPTIQATDGTDTKLDESKRVQHTITLSMAVSTTDLPKVVSVQRLRPGSQSVVAAFQEERLNLAQFPTFDVRIVVTEKPRVYNNATDLRDLAVGDIDVQNGTASNLVVGVPFARLGQGDAGAALTPGTPPAADDTLKPHPIEGMYAHAGDGRLVGVPSGFDTMNVPMPTGTDNMYYQYRVTITPHRKSADFDVRIRVKNFNDGGTPLRNSYISPGWDKLPNGREVLTVPVSGAARDLTAGYKVVIPKDWIIPANGYLIIAKDKAESEIDTSGQDNDRTNDTPRATHRTPAQLLYNVYATADLPNLATAFLNGVVIDVESQHAGLMISEVMWGEDTSLSAPANSQYIELYNPGAQYKTVDDADHTPDVNEALTLIFYAPNEFDDVPAVGDDGSLPAGITDRIGTLDANGAYWDPSSKGQSGRSGSETGELTVGRGPVVDPVPIVSMYRGMDADGMLEDGQMTASWMSSAGPKSANFDPLAIGIRHGTPGAATDATDTPADTEAEAKAKADAEKAAAEKVRTTGTIPTEGQIYISEVMFAGGGVLPQWIEIANGSKSEENLSGWTLTIANAAADADVSIGAAAKFTIPDGTMIGAFGQQSNASTILVVTEAGRNNVDQSGQVVNLMTDNEVELILAGVTKRKYTILSADAFSITLAPPEPAKTTPPAGETATAKATRMAAEAQAKADRMEASDMVGNLGADGAAAWALPMSEDGRSSIIRRHVQVAVGPAEPEDGMMMESWILASDTSFAQPTHIRTATYYGAMNDVGTPGFRAGGALPVELSHFRPARDKATGAVVITWSTQSELNNAGFFIKRSQQKDGEFTVINATMIAGAGTTSEKQFYTYTDTAAQPNVVYYYQIEDVSLDGQRQTLTRGIRLKGHVGAAGKLTSTWGELKTSNE